MASIADVYVTVLPETGKIAAGIKKALEAVDDDVKTHTAKWKKQIQDALQGINLDVDTAKAEKKIDQIEKKKPKVKVDVEVDPAAVEKEVEKQADKAKPTVKVDVEADATQVEKEVEKQGRKRKPRVKAEVEADEESMSKLQQDTEALLSKLEIDLDETAKRNKIKKLQSDVNKALSKVGVTLQGSRAEGDLQALRSETARLLSNIDLDFDSEAVDKLMEKFQGDIKVRFDYSPDRDLPGMFNAFSKLEFPTVDLELETKKAEEELETLISKTQSKLRKLLSAKKVGIDVDLDIRDAQQELADLGSKRTVTVDVDTRIDEYQLQREIAESTGAELEDLISKTEAKIRKLLGARKAGLNVDVDMDQAAKELDQLTSMRTVEVDVETRIDEDLLRREIADSVGAALENEIKNAEAKLKTLLKARKAGIDVDVDIGAAAAELEALTRRRTTHVDVDIDHDLLLREAANISRVLAEGASTFGESIKQTTTLLLDQLGAVTRLHPVIAVGVFGSLAGLITDLVGVVAELSGGLALLPSVVTAAAAGIGTLALATDGFGDAIKNMGDPEKFAESLQQLAPNAQQAALSIQAVMPAIDALKASLSQALFANVGPEIINTVNTILPAITPGLTAIAGAFNSMFMQVAHLFQDPTMVATVSTMMSNIAGAFQALAPAVGPFVQAFTQLSAVGASFLPGIAMGLTHAAETFANFVAQSSANGSLQEFIQEAVDAFNQLMPLLPALVNAFMELAPIGEAVLPGLVHSLELFLAYLPTLSLWLMTLGPNFIMIEGVVRAAGAAFDWMQGVISALPTLFDAVQQKAGGVYDAFAQKFPLLGAIVEGAAAAVQRAAQKISDHLDWIIDKLNRFIDSVNSIPILTPFIDIPNIPKDGGPPGASKGGGAAPGQFPKGPDDKGNIPGTDLPWTGPQAPVGTIQSGSGPARPGFGQSGPAPNQPNRTTRPVAPPPPSGIPQIGQPPGGVFDVPVPTPKPPGGGGGGGGGSKPDAVSPVPGAPYTYSGFGELNWDALAEKESGGNWSMNTGNGFYGGLQFVQSTWEAYGGRQFADRADLATKEEQIKVATALYNKEKTAPWPANGWLLTATPDQLRNAGLTSTGKPSSRGGGRGGGGGGYPQPRMPYGLPAVANSGGYGGQGVQFPAWVNQFGQDFGLKPSTYPGHQTSNRNEPGYAPNPQGLNRGIDWTGTPEQMRQMAEYLMQNPQFVEQLIYWDPETGKKYGIAGGKDVTNTDYYENAEGYPAHRGHAHTRQSESIPEPGSYSYDGPGGDRNNPMYTENAKDSGGKQLGQDIVSGIMEIFGLGDLFKDPTQFGLFKIFKGIMGLHPAEQDNGYGNGSGGGGDIFGGLGGGGGGGGNMIDSLLGFIPQPFGALNSGSPTDAPGEFIPGLSSSGGSSVAADLAGLVPQAAPGQQGTYQDNSFHATFGDTKADTPAVMNELDNYYLQHSRANLNITPSK